MSNQIRPILSLCIPTFNRSLYLKQALEALVTNKDFDNEVEIVISDNASTDDTEQIGKTYADKYSNIKYFRNKENIRDSNFSLAMDRSTGLYAKLMNDNHVIEEDGLWYLKERIKAHLKDKTPLFFTGVFFNHPKEDSCICKSLEDFVVHLSFFVTAIHAFGAWRDDWDKVTDRTRYTHFMLNQDDWAYQIVENKKNCIIFSGTFYKYLELTKSQRTGYNWFKVHVENYYAILQPYIERGLISESAMSLERRTYLKGLKLELIQSYLCKKIFPEWGFDTKGTTKILWKHFKMEPFFYLYFLTMPIWGMYWIIRILFIRRILISLNLFNFRSKYSET